MVLDTRETGCDRLYSPRSLNYIDRMTSFVLLECYEAVHSTAALEQSMLIVKVAGCFEHVHISGQLSLIPHNSLSRGTDVVLMFTRLAGSAQ